MFTNGTGVKVYSEILQIKKSHRIDKACSIFVLQAEKNTSERVVRLPQSQTKQFVI